MRIGIFGGTFDPPHLGHLILAAEAADQVQLNKVLWVLTPDPPHKQGSVISPVLHRLAMTQLMVDCCGQFELSDIEFKRPGPHYALDTVNALHQLYPGDELYYIIGGDSLRDLPTWHQPMDFIRACDKIVVMQRPGSTPDMTALYQNYPDLKTRLIFLDVPQVEISAVNIRQRVKQERAFWHFVTPAVNKYIKDNNLYL
jgi:nicotinate-nucleotide adenylyltransferase